MKTIQIATLLITFATQAQARVRETPAEPKQSFGIAAEAIQHDLEQSMAELDTLRAEIADAKIPLSKQLAALENDLSEVRAEYQATTRLLDRGTLNLSNLRAEIKSRQDESTYLSGLLGEYTRSFESRLHIAELERYELPLQAARLAPENSNLTQKEVFEIQSRLIAISLDRLFEALGGARFEGRAVVDGGLLSEGTFLLVGPCAVFCSADGDHVGPAEQRLGSLEPAQLSFASSEDATATRTLVADGVGLLPIDPTLGSAHKLEATENESWIAHVKKGGPVMVPIFAMASIALVIGLLKWLSLASVRKPSSKAVTALVEAVSKHDLAGADQSAGAIKGPVGQMLRVGVEHLAEPRELIEEAMYEVVLRTRLRVQRFLPFIAICAASAPLLGLLGTVTGIINTFKMITVFGSSDVKSLSGGISEALITTKYGLIVAIPALLVNAFLSRKARGVTDQMEAAGVQFVNQVGRTPMHRPASAATMAGAGAPDPRLVRAQVKEIVSNLLGPLVAEAASAEPINPGAAPLG